MAIDLAAHIETAIAHLRAGAVQAADDLLSDVLVKHHEDLVATGNAPPPPPPAAAVIVYNILNLICAKLGSPAPMEQLLADLAKLV